MHFLTTLMIRRQIYIGDDVEELICEAPKGICENKRESLPAQISSPLLSLKHKYAF